MPLNSGHPVNDLLIPVSSHRAYRPLEVYITGLL